MNQLSVTDIVERLMFIFNEKQALEEQALKQSPFRDISVKDMHTIVAVGVEQAKNLSEIAKELGVTLGTLSVSMRNLNKKGYVARHRHQDDRRQVFIKLTNKGRVVYRLNQRFYANMVQNVFKNIQPEESEVLLKVLDGLHDYIVDTSQTLSVGTNI